YQYLYARGHRRAHRPRPQRYEGDTMRTNSQVSSPWSRSPVVRGPVVRSPVVRGPVVRSPVVHGSVVRGPVVRNPWSRSPAPPHLTHLTYLTYLTRRNAFTLIEIAICLAVIGFAL